MGEQKITEKIVLAYSGGLDTSVLIKWLQEKYNAEVITVTVNVGQPENLKEVEEKAKKLGVLKHYSIDAEDEFAKTARKINSRAKEVGTDANYDEKWGD